MTDNQLAVLLDSIALNLENEIYYLEEHLPKDLLAYKDANTIKVEPDRNEITEEIPYFPCTELLWSLVKKLRDQSKSLEHQPV